MDFTVGQYGTSNGNVNKIFTLTSEDEIQELKIDGRQELFISGGQRTSILLDTIDRHSFKVEYYDNAAGKQVEEIYTWGGTQFVQVRDSQRFHPDHLQQIMSANHISNKMYDVTPINRIKRRTYDVNSNTCRVRFSACRAASSGLESGASSAIASMIHSLI